jgi:outer membrane protein
MKKRIILLIIPIIIVAIFGSHLEAEIVPSQKKLAIGVGSGYPLFFEDQYKNDIMFSLNLYYSLNKSLRLELKSLFIGSDVGEALEPTDLAPGRLNMTALQLSLQYRIKLNNRVFPYLGAGAGYYFSDFVITGEDEWQTNGFNIIDEIDNNTGFHIGLGLDYYFSSKMMVNLDARYCLVSIGGTYSITELVSGISQTGNIDSTINPLMISVGFTLIL